MLAFLAAVWPWVVFPLLVLWRVRGSRTLDDEAAEPVDPRLAPPVTIVIPARDEASTIAACVRAALATRWPRLAVVVVDDHSSDGTGDLARAAGEGDPRLLVTRAPPLPEGWMGKQWACATGAAHARLAPHGHDPSSLLLFVDADTVVSPDLVARAAGALANRGVVLLSVVGRQRMESFWERVVQPHVLVVLAGRYGSTERMARARRAGDKIANGQCLLVRRDAYDAIGGHGAVRDSVSEDLVLAKRLFGAGHEVGLVLAPRQLATRMYDSLDGIVRGWRKNIYAGGRESMPGGSAGRAIFPLLLLLPPLLSLVPPAAAMASAVGLASAFTMQWAVAACVLLLGWWALAYRRLGLSATWAATWPLGASVLLWIVVGAVARGSRVEWRGRTYESR